MNHDMTTTSSRVLAVLLMASLGCGGGESSAATDSTETALDGTTGGEAEIAPAPAPRAETSTWDAACEAPLDALRASGEANTFLELAARVGIDEDIRTLQGGTVIAPTDAAFAALAPETRAALEADPRVLRNALAGHFLMGTMRTSSLREQESIELLDQQRTTLPVQELEGAVALGDARLIRPDLECPSVIVHLVDRVLAVGEFDPERRAGPFGVNLWVLPE